MDEIDDSRAVTRASGPARPTGLVDPTVRLDARASAPPEESFVAPGRVGRYHVEERIGEGGMGVVLRARDPELGRVVAIKLLRSRRSSRAHDPTKRLLREAQAMARLSHPNVIEVYDVGEVDGRVFIAMEHVAGQTLGRWLRRAEPSRRAIVDAFVQAGRGLAAAHRVGLVHRDFKPTNVLRGEDGRVRVLDFGLATPPRRGPPGTSTAADEDGLLDARVTATGLVMGTPAYMAPECHCGEVVDARSDQFSFCVALYEALYGERPFPGPSAEEIADQSSLGIIQLPPGRDVPPHLRDAVLRGLLPDPPERWPSMDALLDQLRPAHRPRRGAGLLVAGVGLAGLAALLLPSSPPPTTCESAAARVEEVWNHGVSERLEEAFSSAGLSYGPDSATRARARLDAYAEALAAAQARACEAEAPPAQHACLDERLLELRGVVAVLERGEPTSVRNAVAAVSELPPVDECGHSVTAGPTPPSSAIADDVLRGREDLSLVRARLGAGTYERALTLVESTLAQALGLGYEPLVAEAQYLRGRVLEERGEYDAAEQQLVDALLLAESTGHDQLAATAATRLVFVVGSHLGRNDDAERWARHAEAAIDRLPPRHSAELQLEATLGSLRWSQGRLAEAREHYEHALAARQATLGMQHPLTLSLRSNLALVCHQLGDLAEARSLMRSTVDDQVEVLGPTHPQVAASYGNLGVIELDQGQLRASIEHTEAALEGLRTTVGERHPHYPRLLTNLAKAQLALGHPERARRRQQRALQLFEETMGPRSVMVGHAHLNLGAIDHELRRYREASAAYRRALEIWSEHLRPDHPDLAIALENLALVDLELGRLAEAAAGFDRALALLQDAYGDEHPSLAASLLGRGRTRLARGQLEPALEDLERAVSLREGEVGDPVRLGEARFRLGEALWAAGRHGDASVTVERALAEVRHRSGAPLRAEIEAWLAAHPFEPG